MRSYIRGWCHGPVAQNKIHAGSDVPLYLHRYGSWLVEDSHLNKEKKSEEKKISGHNVKVGQKIMFQAQGWRKQDILWLAFLLPLGLVPECREILHIQNSISPGRPSSSVTSQVMSPISPLVRSNVPGLWAPRPLFLIPSEGLGLPVLCGCLFFILGYILSGKP